MIEFRQLEPDDDLSAVLDLCRDFFAEYESHHEAFFDTDGLTDDDISGRFLDSLESDDSATIVALDGDRIVGYTSLAIHEQPPFYKVKRAGAISALMVTPDYRGKGIATRLLDEARGFFGNRGVRYFTFYTAVGNKDAIRLYEKCGMKPLHMSFLGET